MPEAFFNYSCRKWLPVVGNDVADKKKKRGYRFFSVTTRRDMYIYFQSSNKTSVEENREFTTVIFITTFAMW